jgi:hypothetical protein
MVIDIIHHNLDHNARKNISLMKGEPIIKKIFYMQLRYSMFALN